MVSNDAKTMFLGVVPEERKLTLKENSYVIEEDVMFQKDLSPEEIEGYHVDLMETTIKINTEREELKDVTKRFKDKLKEHECVRNEAANAVKYGSISVTGTLYGVDDQEARMMNFYGADGVWVKARPLTSKERQLSIRTAAAE